LIWCVALSAQVAELKQQNESILMQFVAVYGIMKTSEARQELLELVVQHGYDLTETVNDITAFNEKTRPRWTGPGRRVSVGVGGGP
jgi:hypothetical protein